jgi:uncharacterized 2Fe-2S/4Fe-4S cluster protein (DUF4445 family)
MEPIIRTVSLTLEPPTPSDKRADRERFLDALRIKTGDLSFDISTDLLRELPAILRNHNFSVSATLGYLGDTARILSLSEGKACAVAVDIGTTNIAASLYDMNTGEKIGYREVENPQIAEGTDVLTRMHIAMNGKGAELHQLLMEGVNGAIMDLCTACSFHPSAVSGVAIAGNTVMTHFLLDFPVHNLPVEPYIPVAHHIGFISPGDIGLRMNPEGIVYVFPNTGSYVGGDIVAGILSSGLSKEEKPCLLIDVGTNAEIVLGCRDWIMVGAGAAGPALEGGISAIGMRAVDGAICGVEIDRQTYEITLRTIRSSEPKGICGSGMIELVAELYGSGLLDAKGALAPSGSAAGRIIEEGGIRGFLLHGDGKKRLVIWNPDIDNFMRSKAAMFASLQVMVSSVGLAFSNVGKVFVSGAFGTGIDAGKAASIGMVPEMGGDRIHPIGNSSLRGAEMLLLNRHLVSAIEKICGMVTYREMNTDGEFMRQFPAGLFIPHTDPDVLKG